jgi:hypothetical protein
MRNIDNTTRMTLPVLDVIDSSKSDYPGMSWFSMRVSPNRPAAEGEGADAATADKPAAKAAPENKAAPESEAAKEAKK